MTTPKQVSRNWWAALPLFFFLLLAFVFYYLLVDGKDASEIPSALLDKPAPQLTLDALEGSGLEGFEPNMFSGKLTVVNVFASWCTPCRQEHPQIVQLAKDPRITIVGLNHKDEPANALKFLDELGNPYDRIGIDPKGRASIEWGVYGIPETFLIGSDGKIFFKHVGPISLNILKTRILPLIEEASKQ